MRVESTVTFSSHVSALGQRDGEAVAYTESSRGGRASSARILDDKSTESSITGTSPQGEEDTPAVLQTLLQALQLGGQAFDEVVNDEEPADGVFRLSTDPKDSAQPVQVVRAIREPGLWATLARSGGWQAKLTPSEIDEGLRDAIQSKALKLPSSTKNTLILALDATRLPGLAFDDCVADFRRKSAGWAREQGFREIWLVGPSVRLTARLDVG